MRKSSKVAEQARRSPLRAGTASRIAIAAAFATPTLLATGVARADQQAVPATTVPAGSAGTEQVGQQGASPADSGDAQLQEVVVTARYKSENLQTTPIAITALTGEQLEERGMTNVAGVSQSAPNVTIEQGTTGNGKAAEAMIRGVGQTNFSFALEPGVGMYIDDVYFSTVFGGLLDLMDVNNVEVLRGPQGTLFGRNSEGGAVRIYSVKPQGDDSGYVSVGYGNYNQVQVRGAFDVSLIPDQLFLRLSGGSNRMDGYMTVLDYACANPGTAGNIQSRTLSPGCQVGKEGGDDTSAVRAQLRWLPADKLEVNLSVDFMDDQGEATPDKLFYINPNYPGASLAAYNSSVAIPKFGIPIDGRFMTNSPYTTYADFLDRSNGLEFPNVSNDRDWGGSLDIRWETPQGIRIKSISAYRGYDGEFSFDQGGSPLAVAMNYNTVSHHQFSQEVDISSDHTLLARELEWTVGGYYFNGDSYNGGTIDLPTYGFAFTQNDPASDRNESGFLHVIYHLTEELSFEGGYRHTNEDKSYTFDHVIEPGGVPLFPQTTGAVSYGRSDYKVGLQYQFTPQVMAYADTSTGFKAGGVNPRPLTAAQVTTFLPEQLTSYEVGVKAEAFDRRLRVNGAVFLSNYSDLQTQAEGVDNTGLLAILYENVGRARISGAEAEIDAEPIKNLLFNSSVGYLHYKTLSLGSAAGVSGGPTETSVPIDTPTWTGNVGAQYRIRLDKYGSLTPRLDYSYRSLTYADAPNTPFLAQPGYGLLNGRLAWALPNPEWTLAFQVQNITNKVYYMNKAVDLPFGTVDAQPGMPRMFMGTIKRNF